MVLICVFLFVLLIKVFKESLRLHPPATGTVREAPSNCVLAGVKIPQGAPICVSYDRPDIVIAF